ncbi:hypothetical protein SAMN05892883_2068 [Jatrophihabitans sp. GAS493]|uniref:hypothetical protein n=1 Tax=Jatrophihabitans sp. GAS493 TaxID=1907575 RepID=UPI000BB88A00|nr:hypothetical protein [Jatrophihabitans sp. GAS493]SOD72718.1 hypothetical protein SAMN05892883_2068 [Jatrophihabitans sp. GAS493]
MADDIGSIVGYLKLDRSDWNRGFDEAEARADSLKAHSPRIDIHVDVAAALAALKAVQVEEKKVADANVKVKSTAKDASGSDGLGAIVQAALLIGPAIGPIAGAAVGAAGALGFMGITGILALKGIQNQLNESTVAGADYREGVTELNTMLQQLEATAAGGVLGGFNSAVAQARDLFPDLNGEVAYFGVKLGDIVSHVLPGLIDGLHTLEPLFQFVAEGLDHGAQKFQSWSAASGGLAKFGAYAESVLPQVVATLSDVVQMVIKLGTAFSSTGVTVLSVLDDMAQLINAIPLPVLQALAVAVETGVVSWKLYQGLTFVSNFYDKVTAKMAANTAANAANTATAEANATAQASLSAAQGTAYAAADALAAAEADLAAANELAETQAAALTEVTYTLGAGFEANAEAAYAYEVALAAQADAAAAAATAAAGLSEANAALAVSEDAVAESGAAAGVGVSAAFGPVGIIVGVAAAALAVFGLANAHSANDTLQNVQAVQSLTSALEASSGALDQNVRDQVIKTLADKNAYAQATQLGISQKTLTDAALGNVAAQQEVAKATQAATVAGNVQTTGLGNAVIGNDALSQSLRTQQDEDKKKAKTAGDLTKTMTDQAGVFADATQRQADYAAAGGTVNAALATQAATLQGHAAILGATADDYAAATTAMAQTTAQTAQQTLAFQLENNAAGLVNAALQTMAGQNLSVAQAQTAADQAVMSATDSLRKNKGVVNEHTKAGLEDRQAIEGAASALRAKLSADAAAGDSSAQATKKYNDSSAALLAQIGRLDGTKSAAYKYAQQILKIPTVAKTQADFDADAATKYIAAYAAKVRSIPVSVQLSVGVNGDAIIAGGQQSQRNSQIPKAARAAGGPIGEVHGPGSHVSDSVRAINTATGGQVALSDGEYIETAASAAINSAALAAANRGAKLAVVGPSVSSPAAAAVRASYAQTAPAAVPPAQSMPSTLVIVDADGVLMGRMQVAVDQSLGHVARQIGYINGKAT